MAVLAHKGHSIAPTTLGWVGGALLSVVLVVNLFTHQRQPDVLTEVPQLQGYTQSACTDKEIQPNLNGSFRLIWRPRSVIAQNVLLEGVSVLTPY